MIVWPHSLVRLWGSSIADMIVSGYEGGHVDEWVYINVSGFDQEQHCIHCTHGGHLGLRQYDITAREWRSAYRIPLSI